MTAIGRLQSHSTNVLWKFKRLLLGQADTRDFASRLSSGQTETRNDQLPANWRNA
jgi:hypothetical protein